MILAIPPNTEASCFDSREAKPDCFPKCGGIDVGYPILIANSPIREIEALSWYIPIRIGSVVGR